MRVPRGRTDNSGRLSGGSGCPAETVLKTVGPGLGAAASQPPTTTGKMNSMHGCRPHCRSKIYEIRGRHYLGIVPEWLKTKGPKADRLWAALAGVGPTFLGEYFADETLRSMVSDLAYYYRGELQCLAETDDEDEERDDANSVGATF